MLSKNFTKNYNLLNPKQRLAVDSIEGPILVVAGPGTGKTQVLTLRIANILLKTDVSPHNILALTFTENASLNMRKRLSEFIGSTAYKVKICTFHGFANEIIQTFPEKFSFKAEMKQIDDLTKHSILQAILSNYDPLQTYETFVDFFQDQEIQNEICTHLKKQLYSIANPYLYIKDLLSTFQSLKKDYVLEDKLQERIKQAINNFNSLEKINEKTKKTYIKWDEAKNQIFKNIELLYCFKKYNQELSENGLYDYEDMICFVTSQLEKDDKLLAYVQEKYLYTLVDEYQDTNGSQNQILKLIGSFDSNPNIFVVGDDDQSIYKFQGANIENILDFANEYPNCQTITLDENYRSSQEILDLSQTLIQNNTQRLTKRMEGVKKELKAKSKFQNQKDCIHLLKFEHGDFEYFSIANKIKELRQMNVDLSQIAILTKRHENYLDIVDFLNAEDIPVNITASKDILEESVIQNLIILLKSINDPCNDEYLAQVLLYNFFDLNRVDILKILYNYSKVPKKDKTCLFEYIQSQADLESVNLYEIEKIKMFLVNMLKLRENQARLNLVSYFIDVLEESNLLKATTNNHDTDSLISLKTLFAFIKNRCLLMKNYSLNDFLQDLETLKNSNLKLPKENITAKENGINLMTVHASKGLEFKYVFIPKFIDKLWGNTRNSKKINILKEESDLDNEIVNLKDLKNEEERRLLFVALTRAKKHLYISSSSTYTQDEKVKSSSISQFSFELDKTLINEVESRPPENIEEIIASALLNKKKNIDYSTQEREYLKTIVSNFRLSVTALNNFLCDPENFVYSNLLRIPKAKILPLMLGTAIHKALEHFFQRLIENNPKDLNYILYNFEKALENELVNSEDFEKLLQDGKQNLSLWYQNYQNSFITPFKVEHVFQNCFLDDIELTAKIDKIEWIDQKRGLVKLIDYKTGSPKTKGVVSKPLDGKEESNLYRQLVFYKLISTLDSNFHYKILECELDFIKKDKKIFRKVSFEIPDEDVEKLKEIIRVSMQKIRNLDFSGIEK